MFDAVLNALSEFCFLYPLFMSWIWIAGSLYYWVRFERRDSDPARPPELTHFPKVALVVPCYNEEANARETILNLLDHDYPNFEVIAVNDGSKDQTGAILDALAAEHPRLRVIHQRTNQGKAVGLTAAALLTDAEFVLGIDGDALLDHMAARWMVRHFIANPHLGAITGNPRLRTRSTLLGRIQVGEFSSIVGLIKRAQRIYGRLFSVSGVCVMFRKAALTDVGFWSSETLTEDIDITWKLQVKHWEVSFEPAATCWILMPETVTGLWKQRLRWATGGAQAILKYKWIWTRWSQRMLWPVHLEYGLSMLWAYLTIGVAIAWAIKFAMADSMGIAMRSLIPAWTGVLIAFTAMLQTAVAMLLDSRYDHRLWRNYFYMIWYPLAYWLLGLLTSAVAFPKALLRKKGERGLWISPDRGLR